MNIGKPLRVIEVVPQPEPFELPGKAIPENVPQTAPVEEPMEVPV